MNFLKNLSKKLFTAGILFLLLFAFLHPKEALAASKDGMKLWLETLLPTLLPFIILTGILLHTGKMETLLSPLSIFWKKVFGLSPWGAYAFLLGMLCGYPMGAKLASDLYEAGKLSRRESHYLLTFSNNASPAFLITYLYGICLKEQTPCGQIFFILFLSDAICMLFFRFIIYQNNTVTPILHTQKETSTAPVGKIIDVSIMNGFETMTRLGGYILLFSLLSAAVCHYDALPQIGELLLLGCCEITTGLCRLAASGLPYLTRLMFSMMLTAFGGLCIMAQTKSVLKRELSILPYLGAKILNASITGILVLVTAKIV